MNNKQYIVKRESGTYELYDEERGLFRILNPGEVQVYELARVDEGVVRQLVEALGHLLEHTEHRGDACKFLAAGKAQIVLAHPSLLKYRKEGQ